MRKLNNWKKILAGVLIGIPIGAILKASFGTLSIFIVIMVLGFVTIILDDLEHRDD